MSIATAYIGSKNANGVLHTIINNIPFHTRYFELYAGSASIYQAKVPANWNLLCDINPHQVTRLKETIDDDHTIIKCLPAMSIIAAYDFGRSDFVYLDPPYPFPSRRTGKKYYKYEMNQDDHAQLLQEVKAMKGNIMISTRKNDLYAGELKDWRKVEISTADRAGACTEIIYTNYDSPALLHQYDYVGHGFTDRQRINRKIKRFELKLAMLQAYEKHLFIQELIKNDYAAVVHFLKTKQP